MKCLIIDEMHERIIQDLKAPGLIVDYRPDISISEVYEIIVDYQILVLRSKLRIGVDLLEKASELKIIARAGAGIENIDLSSITNRSIEIINAPEGNRSAVGEHALGMILNLLNKIGSADTSVRNMQWEREFFRGRELDGSTVGIIGYGNMGHSFAQKLRGFDVKVLAYDKYKSGFGNDFVQESSLEQIFSDSEILSLHVPLTEETHGMCTIEFIDSFRNSIILINTSRGAVLPFKTIAYGLDSGRITAAGLDVFESEPLDRLGIESKGYFETIKKHPNVVLTPHVAGWTFESYEKISQVLAEKILARL